MGVGFDVLSNEEKGHLQQSLGRQRLPEGALAQVKNVVCVASGKGGVGKSTMTANLAAALAADGHSAGALDCDVYGYSIPRMLGVNSKPEVNAERKIIPLTAPARRQGDVDRLLRRGERRRGLARPDAPQGDPAVPRGRGLGRPRLPAARPAAGHGRRLDDAGSAPAAGEDPDRHDAAAGRPERRPPRRRDGREGRPRAPRSHREHVRLHGPRRTAHHHLRRGRRPAPRRRARHPAPGQGAPLRRSSASTPTPARRWSSSARTTRPRRRSATPRAASWPPRPRSFL